MNNDAAEFIPAWISVMFSETGFLSLCCKWNSRELNIETPRSYYETLL